MLKSLHQDFLQLIYPHLCLGCGERLTQPKEVICFQCIEQLPYTNESILHNSLSNKLCALSGVEGVYTMCYYNRNSILQELLKELKYRNQPQVGHKLGLLLGRKLQEQNLLIDEIVPVPLHTKRKRKRGYNQAKEIALGVSQRLNCPVNEVLLLRTKHTKTQTKRSKMSRFENVENIFAVQTNDQLKNKRILLVDDVITTGATILSCANVLLQSGAYCVYLTAIGKADVL